MGEYAVAQCLLDGVADRVSKIEHHAFAVLFLVAAHNPSLDRRRERFGASLFYNDPKLPMELSFEHLFDDLSSGSRTLIDEEERASQTSAALAKICGL